MQTMILAAVVPVANIMHSMPGFAFWFGLIFTLELCAFLFDEIRN